MRTAEVSRKTNETDITLRLNLDGRGLSNINSGSGFFDHMLTLFAAHGGFDLDIVCNGDTEVDYHHSVEDIGIALGTAFSEALGDKRGITRYGSFILPMDEALILCAVDLSGRCHLNYDLKVPAESLGDFDTEVAREFMYGFARTAACALHFKQLDGIDSHHILEGAFKAMGRALKMAVSSNGTNEIPSTKGVL